MSAITRKQYIDALLQQYHVVHVLADKNNCQVLQLRHKKLERDLVLHSFPTPIPAYETLCDLRTDCLPEIYDALLLSDGQVVLEEYIDGITLEQAMEVERYRYSDAKKVLQAVCRALDILHRNGFVHRDVKPENIVIGSNGRIVLLDLNASRIVSDACKDTVVMGTVGYASPEQLGLSQSDARTDIYAAGVLFNVMLTGEHPSTKLADGKAGRIVRKCTNVSPDERYQSAQKLARAL